MSNLEIINVTSDIYTPRRGVFVCCGEKGGKYCGITLKNLYVHNITTSFGREAGGIIVWCDPADSPVSYDGVTITGCTVCDTGAQGITFFSAYSYRITILPAAEATEFFSPVLKARLSNTIPWQCAALRGTRRMPESGRIIRKMR